MKNIIDSSVLYRMFLSGCKRLESKKEWINELNVFPVPDGDTGTNMTMTAMSAAKEVSAVGPDDMEALCKAISSGSLRGARGNSGVILSQLLRGFTKGARDYAELNVDTLTLCLDKAVETAYKAVMKPKEGTILTVARGAYEKARELSDEGVTDIELYMEQVITYADEVLQKTPDMLLVLKQAGVVDSGGQGLVEFLKGALEGYKDENIDISLEQPASANEGAKGVYASGKAAEIDTANIKFVYCTEFIILLKSPFAKKQEKEFKAYLDSMGDSVVMVADEDLCKVHIHSNDPGLVLQRAMTFGELSNMKIDNMRMEHRERLFSINYETGDAVELETEVSGMAERKEAKALGNNFNKQQSTAPKMTPSSSNNYAAGGETAVENMEHKDIGFIAVCAGDGMAEIFKSLGADFVISGGQTMNPSTADILDAVDKVNADTVFVLPNNKNIILAATQAVKMSKEKDIRVIPTKTVPQGISALLGFMEGYSPDENEESMNEAVEAVKSGEVTYAVRDTVINDVEIHEGDYMGIGDEGILAVDKGREEVVLSMLEKLVDEDTALISLYYGNEVDEETADSLQEKLNEKYESVEIDLQYGGQPVYYYIISVE